MTPHGGQLAPFRVPYAGSDEEIAKRLLAEAARPADAERRINQRATALIEGIRGRSGGLGGIEDFLHAYSLSTKEGLALMVLAVGVRILLGLVWRPTDIFSVALS